MENENQMQIILSLIVLGLLATLGYSSYVFSGSLENIDVVSNHSYYVGYNEGYNAGVEYWNKEVISKTTYECELPYWYNQTRLSISVEQSLIV